MEGSKKVPSEEDTSKIADRIVSMMVDGVIVIGQGSTMELTKVMDKLRATYFAKDL